MHTKLSHEDTEEVFHYVLSTLPFPRDYTQEASLHLPFLLTLMEAIDMIYLETLNPQSAQPDGSADKSELPVQQSSPSVPSHGTAGQDAEGDTELEQHSTSTSSARKRPADETSPLPRPKHKRKKRHCRDAEDDMMQSDAELGAMEEQITTEVNQESDTDRTTDTTTHEDGKPVHVSKRRDLTLRKTRRSHLTLSRGKRSSKLRPKFTRNLTLTEPKVRYTRGLVN